jgi:hypothetical protein
MQGELMKKFFTVLFAFSSIFFLNFLYRWIFVEGGNEPFVTLFSAVLSPLFWFLRNYFSKKDANPKQIVINYTEATEPINEFNVTINKALIIADSEYADYRFQIEVSMNALGRSIYIKDLKLECTNYVFSKQVINLLSYFSVSGEDYLRLSVDDYIKKIGTLSKNLSENIIIRNDEWFYCLFTDTTHSERLPDGYENFEINNWNLIVTYNGLQTKTIPFSFKVHSGSFRVPTGYRYTGFNGIKD